MLCRRVHITKALNKIMNPFESHDRFHDARIQWSTVFIFILLDPIRLID